MASTQFFIFAILAVLVPSIVATDFVVGDDKGDQLGKLALKPLFLLFCQLKCFAFC